MIKGSLGFCLKVYAVSSSGAEPSMIRFEGVLREDDVLASGIRMLGLRMVSDGNSPSLSWETFVTAKSFDAAS